MAQTQTQAQTLGTFGEQSTKPTHVAHCDVCNASIPGYDGPGDMAEIVQNRHQHPGNPVNLYSMDEYDAGEVLEQ